MKKKLVSLILAVVILLGIVPSLSISADTKKGYKKRTTSEIGICFIEAFEGYNQYAYWDYEHYTIGYGSTCQKDEYPAGISEPFAHQLFKNSLGGYESGLNSFLKENNIYVTQNQYDALLSFTYNFGAYVWKRNPTIAKYLKKGIDKYTDKQIADAFGLWVNAGGQRVEGLVIRRAAEAKLFCTDDFSCDDELYVATENLNIRTTASASGTSVGSYKCGDVFSVLEKKYSANHVFGKVLYKKKEYWVNLNYAKYANVEESGNSLIATCLYSVVNVNKGIKLSWKKVNGASGYKIYKKADGESSYKLLKTITKSTTVSFTDNSVKQMKYKYYVVAYNSKKNADKSGVSTISYVAAPKLSSLSKVSNGFKISWVKQTSASGYQILRKNSGDNTYTPIANVSSSQSSYIDTKAVGGIKYFYAVKSYNSGGLSGESNAKSGIYLSAPIISKSTNTKNSIKIHWNSAYGAKGYYVYRKTAGSSSQKNIATIKSGSVLNYTDKSIASNKSYYYSIKAYNNDVSSVMGAQFSAKVYVPPVLSSIKSESDGIRISWKSAPSATKYNIYRRLASSNTYSKIASTSSKAYLDKTVKSGERYYYKVTTVANKSESYMSSPKNTTFFGPSKITSAATVSNGVKLSWNKVSGAKSYSVYACSSKTNKLLKTVTTNSYIDSKLKESKTRTYAIKVNYKSGTSGLSAKFKAYNLATPKLSVKASSGGLLLSWSKVKNATGVIIYRKDPGGKYKLYTKQENYGKYTFDNTTVVKGKKYTYKVKVIRGNNTSLPSKAVAKTK